MLDIEEIHGDPVIDISLDTLKLNKQELVFVNTKRSAEACAEKIASKIDLSDEELFKLEEISSKVEKVISPPTKQCKRLARILKKGVAFHHSGLHSKQRELVEDGFRSGLIKIICSTPTLAAGLDLPAFRVIIRDLKRFGGGWGMSYIPVLEYEQMSGRAGRPKYDSEGQAICLADSVEDQENIWEKYVTGEAEELISKLAVEPVLRMYVLSLVATDYANSVESLMNFMSETFYAKQYKNMENLRFIINNIVDKLDEWEFIEAESEPTKTESSFFTSANKLKHDRKLKATVLGARIAELYLDPFTANYLLTCMRSASSKSFNEFGLLQMISWTLELRPRVKARQKDMEMIEEKLILESDLLISSEPDIYADEYDDYLDSAKTAMVFENWIEEIPEEQILESHNVTPGELNNKLDRADWLLYSCFELSKIQGFREVSNKILRLRIRMKNGIKEELLPLIKLKNVGRARARKLFRNKIRNLGDVKKVDVSILGAILGDKLAIDIKKQVGQELSPEKLKVKPNKRKGQISLGDYDESK
ncbi:hypothetical protein COV13_02100 [Candidatus Woesearchaeota archaeon CG10_big_fil_rev_8_21_14_0_10_32_9]|nr:MAG: hypothetical protein COV13_02100 [Candidatus Woesearchaeota archaeon CG10_big_fil_rev_8_21_14_0_10_32_9]